MFGWIKNVKTKSTFPPKRVFTKKANEIASMMEKEEVSPAGLGSAIKMIQFFINRAGNKLNSERKKELEKAKINLLFFIL